MAKENIQKLYEFTFFELSRVKKKECSCCFFASGVSIVGQLWSARRTHTEFFVHSTEHSNTVESVVEESTNSPLEMWVNHSHKQ